MLLTCYGVSVLHMDGLGLIDRLVCLVQVRWSTCGYNRHKPMFGMCRWGVGWDLGVYV